MPMGYLIGWEPLPYGNSAVQHAEVAVLRSSSQHEELLLPPPSLSVLQVFTRSPSLGLLEGVKAG